MPRVLGIDPGTVSFDVCGLDDGDVFLSAVVPSSDVARSPEGLLGILRGAEPLDLVAGPSGYGLPFVPLEAVGERELRLLYLAEAGQGGRVGGLRALVRLLREARLPVVFTPGVVHLPTVPAHRKTNRIDLGTADKVCVAALAVRDQSRHLGIGYRETSFVLAELGGAFTAVLSVENGRIVSGQGGSSGPLGYLGAGALDGEVAALLGGAGKDAIFSGGAAFVSGDPEGTPGALMARSDEAARRARDAFVESLVKAVAAELALIPLSREILLSGRLSRIPGFYDPVAAALSRFGPVRRIAAPAGLKEAALGAALLADGLAGGASADLLDAMGLQGASGTALDHVHLNGAGAVREWALGAS